MPCDLLETQEAACISGIGKISNPIELLQVIAQLSCERADATETEAIVESFVERSGISDQSQIDAITGLVQAARDNGWWEKCDLVYPFVGETAGAHAHNLKSASFTITWNGTVTHDADGITGNGTDGYGDTGYIPSTSGTWQQRNCHCYLYRRSYGSAVPRTYAGVLQGANLFSVRQAFSVDRFSLAMNDIANANMGILPSSLGSCMGAKLDAALRRAYFGGVEYTAVASETSVPSFSVYVLALNQQGASASFVDSNLAGLTIGSGITFAEYQLMASDWQTFQTALGRQV